MAIDKQRYERDMKHVHKKLGQHEKLLGDLQDSQEKLQQDQSELKAIVEGRDKLVGKALQTMPKWGSVMLGGLGILVSILTLIVGIMALYK